MLHDGADEKDGKLSQLADEVRASGADVGFATFAALLFSRADADDLKHYHVEDLYRLAQAAWRSVQNRRPGEPRVVIMTPDQVAVTEEDSGRDICVIEAVNDDKPFLFGSLSNELHAQNIEIHLVVHPIFAVERDENGRLIGFHGEARPGDGFRHESFVHVHIAAIDDQATRDALQTALMAVHRDVDAAVADWPKMRKAVSEIIDDYQASPPPVPRGS